MRERGLLDRALRKAQTNGQALSPLRNVENDSLWSGVHSDLSLTRRALALQLAKEELHSRSISVAATVPEAIGFVL